MESPLAVLGIAEEFRPELAWVREQWDGAIRDSVRMFVADRGRNPDNTSLSVLAREAMAHLAGMAAPPRRPGARPRLYIEPYRQNFIKILLAGIGPLRLRKRPQRVTHVKPMLAPVNGVAPLFDVPAGDLVFLWEWDASIGMLRSLYLARVVSLDELNQGMCSILEEVEIGQLEYVSFLHEGAGSADDDLGDMLSRWDEEVGDASDDDTDIHSTRDDDTASVFGWDDEDEDSDDDTTEDSVGDAG